MRKVLRCILGVVFIAILLLSIPFISSKPEYKLTQIEEISTDENYINITYKETEELEEIIDETILGILTIEKIGLKAKVKEGSTQDILREYIGYMPETAKYEGNIGLAAHNRGTKYSYFARLNELEKGDKIIYKTKFYERTYVVTKKVVIYDTDWSYLKTTKDNRITMITCIANKPSQRLCVQAVEEK